jgi:hypothetical protein
MRLEKWFESKNIDLGIELLRQYGIYDFDTYYELHFVPISIHYVIEKKINHLIEINAKPVEVAEKQEKIAVSIEIREKHKLMSFYRKQLFSDLQTVRAAAAGAMMALDKELTVYYRNRKEKSIIAPEKVIEKPKEAITAEISQTTVDTILKFFNEKKALDKFFERVQKQGKYKKENILPNFQRWQIIHEKLYLPFDKHINDYFVHEI